MKGKLETWTKLSSKITGALKKQNPVKEEKNKRDTKYEEKSNLFIDLELNKPELSNFKTHRLEIDLSKSFESFIHKI